MKKTKKNLNLNDKERNGNEEEKRLVIKNNEENIRIMSVKINKETNKKKTKEKSRKKIKQQE